MQVPRPTLKSGLHFADMEMGPSLTLYPPYLELLSNSHISVGTPCLGLCPSPQTSATALEHLPKAPSHRLAPHSSAQWPPSGRKAPMPPARPVPPQTDLGLEAIHTPHIYKLENTSCLDFWVKSHHVIRDNAVSIFYRLKYFVTGCGHSDSVLLFCCH